MKKLLSLFALLFFVSNIYAQEFITHWNLSSPSTTSISFNIESTGPVNYTWETIPAGSSGSGTLVNSTNTITSFPTGSVIRLKIDTTNFRHFKMYASPYQQNLIDVEQWGSVNWNSMDSTFYNCNNLNVSANDIPNLNSVTSTSAMFHGCSSLIGPSNIGSWNTQTVQDMSRMFAGASLFNQNIGNWNTVAAQNMHVMFGGAIAFNQPIGNWNTASVQNMSSMFALTLFNQNIGNWNTGMVQDMSRMFYGTLFNQNIGNWNTSSVVDMSSMFSFDTAFNQNIGNWNTALVQDMSYMFDNVFSFNQNIGNWNTSSVKNMNNMFSYATSFNQPIGNWNTSAVTDMSWMFEGAYAFNQPIGSWNTDSVNEMVYMFYNATSFNQPIGNWNTGSVKNLADMFGYASSFNQDISNWNTSAVKEMSLMFYNATSFNQNIENWNTDSVQYMAHMFHNATSFNQALGAWQLNTNVNLTNMLDSSGIDCNNYSNTLIGWSNNANTPSGRILGAANLLYENSAIPNRNILINTKGWTINGDTLSAGPCWPTSVTQQNINPICTIRPNPAIEKASISIPSDKTQEAFIYVYSSLGSIVLKDKIHLHTGENAYILKTNNLANGNYVVRIQMADKTFINKMLVSK